jgi:hypothetical protein
MMPASQSVLDSLLFYAGFLLIFLLFSEEFNNFLKWVKGRLRRYSWLKILVYPLAGLLFLAALLIIGNSLISLFTSLKFSYD